jgi:serine/threonine protein kinase
VATDIIGRGAFSIVYKGAHKSLNMPVVIKMMRHDLALYPEFLDSFLNEAKTIASLTHEHIVKVYDFEERHRTLFIIMEYLGGSSLKDMICRLRTLPPQLTAKYLIQICSALAYAHRCGIVHRDINPSNIMVQPDDNVKILDFGLACPLGTEDFSSLGTAYYMAPEQIEGLPLDPRTDIYALGITAFEMVTGKRPFPEENTEAMLNLHLTQDITDPGQIISEIPDELREFILKAVRCDPDQRYQDIEQAMAVLKPLAQDDRLPKRESTVDNKKSASIFFTYADENESALQQLVNRFKSDAKALGIDVNIVHKQDH